MPAFEANTVWGKWGVVSIDFMQGVSLIFSRDCRTKFFVTAVNCQESLTVDTKIYILVALGVLGSFLCEIKMNKLNKQYISETGYW